MDRLFNNKGSAIILGIGATLILGLMLAALLPWITAETRFTSMERDGLQARYAAEAGVKRALIESQATPRVWTLFDGANRQFTNNNADNVFYNVVLTDMSGNLSPAPPNISGDYIVRSTGLSGSVSRRAGQQTNIQVLPGRIGMYVGGSFNFKNNLSIGADTIIEMSGQVCDENGNNCISCAAPVAPANRTRCGCNADGTVCTALTGVPSPGPVTLTTGAYTTPLASFDPAVSGKYFASSLTNSSNSDPINFTLTGSNLNVGIYISGDLGNANTNGITFSTGTGTNNTLVVYVDGNVRGKNNFTVDGAVVVIKGQFMSNFNNFEIGGLLVVDDNNPVTINDVETKNNPSFTFDAAAIANVTALGLSLPTEYTTRGVISVSPSTWVKLQ